VSGQPEADDLVQGCVPLLVLAFAALVAVTGTVFMALAWWMGW
jgi:hypothetical protein